MKLYSNADLTAANVGNKDLTLSALTHGITVLNYSNISFNVQSSLRGLLGVVPPYFERTYNTNPGERLEFLPSNDVQGATAQTNMFVDLQELTGYVVPSTVALSQVPGYTMNVAGQMSVIGTPTFNVGSMPSVTIANASLPVSGSVSIASGSVQATIQNASLNSQIMNTVLSQSPMAYGALSAGSAITIPAGGNVSVWYPGPANVGIMSDEIWFRLESSGGKCGSYSVACPVVTAPYGSNFNWWHTFPITIFASYANTIIGRIKITDGTNIGFPTQNFQLVITNTSGTSITDTVSIQGLYKYASVSSKEIADIPVYFSNQYSGTLINGGGLLKQLSFMIQNQENVQKTVVISNGGQIVASIVMPGSASGSSTSQPYNYTFGAGITNNGVTITVSGTAGMCFVTGYGLTA